MRFQKCLSLKQLWFLIGSLGVVVTAGCQAHAMSSTPAASLAQSGPGDRNMANIIYVLTDDLSENLLPFMPNVVQMQKDGVSFENNFVTDSLCCPSRSSILTGKLPHNTGVFTNTKPDGGFHVYKNRGNSKETFAVALNEAGVQTAMMGKYMNLYQPKLHDPEPGWSHWVVGGDSYRQYNYGLNVDSKVIGYGSKPKDYLMDVLSDYADAFIRKNVDRPFLIEIAPFTPHGPYIPAPRHENLFQSLAMPKNSNYNSHPSDAASWLARVPPLSEQEVADAEEIFRKRVRSVQAIDEMIGRLKNTLRELKLDRKTYIVFHSDNGFHLGEHGMKVGKQTAFDEDIKVPLVITGPNVSKGVSSHEIVQNIDLCSTFAEIAGTKCPSPDGVSLLPLLTQATQSIGRDMALIEHRNAGYNPNDPDRDSKTNPPSYKALRSKEFLYVSYATGEREYYDMRKDPGQNHNVYKDLAESLKAKLEQKALKAEQCVGSEQCQEALRWE